MREDYGGYAGRLRRLCGKIMEVIWEDYGLRITDITQYLQPAVNWAWGAWGGGTPRLPWTWMGTTEKYLAILNWSFSAIYCIIHTELSASRWGAESGDQHWPQSSSHHCNIEVKCKLCRLCKILRLCKLRRVFFCVNYVFLVNYMRSGVMKDSIESSSTTTGSSTRVLCIVKSKIS